VEAEEESAEKNMKAVVVFNDGLEMILDVPEHTLAPLTTMCTGRPDRIENVTVHFDYVHSKGYSIYRED
jgi:hypothetical protein